MVDQRTLRRLHETIRRDCMLLVDHVDEEIEHDHLGTITVKVPGLIKQLRDAIPNGREVVAGSRSNDKPLVMSVAAFDIMERITYESVGVMHGGSVEDRIMRSSVEVCQWGPERSGEVARWAQRQAKWVQLIRDLFDPPKKMSLSAPCPHCEASTAIMWHVTDREYVRVPALQISKCSEGVICRCMACGTEWPESRFLLLAKAIGC